MAWQARHDAARQIRARSGWAWQAWLGTERRCGVRLGTAGAAGPARVGAARYGAVRHGRHGWPRLESAGHGRRGSTCPGQARPGSVGHGRQGMAGQAVAARGSARQGVAGDAWPVKARHDGVRHGRLANARPGEAWDGRDGTAGAQRGKSVSVPALFAGAN